MKAAEDSRPVSPQQATASPARSVAEPDDPRLTDAVEEYRALLKAGGRPDRQAFLSRYPPIAAALGECLDALEFLQSAASQLSQPTVDHPAVGPGEVHAEMPLGDFRIVREVGRGGMGVVYEAVQVSLGRRVALKVLPFAAAMDAQQLQRFRNEAQAAAHLQHQHIVPVYAVGCERGVHYYAMQFVDGQTVAALIGELRQLSGLETADAAAACGLASELASRKWAPPRRGLADPQATGPCTPPSGVPEAPAAETARQPAAVSTEHSTRSPAFFRTVAHLGIQAAEALEHAHQLGVIHRDIKPANLLVDVRGHLWVTDFGLAHVQSDTRLTLTGDLVGTLRYMSPEQALAKRGVVDQRTDIYSLGVTLYELLTLEPVFDGGDRQELLRQIAIEEPRPPRRRNQAIPRELETIVLKAMAKSPAERYGLAQELADDLKRFLEDRPIRARRPTLLQRARKWGWRHRTVVRAAVVVFLLAVAALAVSTTLIWRANRSLHQALDREQRTLDRERRSAYFQRIALVERELSANNLSRAEELLGQCPEDLRGWEWRYLQRLLLGKSLPPFAHDAALLCVAISPDGGQVVAGGQDGVITLWDVATGQRRLHFRAHQDHVRSVAFSPDGRHLTSASWDRTAKVWDLRDVPDGDGSPALLLLIELQRHANGVAFSPDGSRLATAAATAMTGAAATETDGGVKVWDAATGRELLSPTGLEKGVHAVAFSPDGQYLASASQDGTVKIWETPRSQRPAAAAAGPGR